jgi:hypothetical protein
LNFLVQDAGLGGIRRDIYSYLPGWLYLALLEKVFEFKSCAIG